MFLVCSHSPLSVNDGEVVTNLRAPKKFVDIRIQEERLAKAERRAKAHRGVRNGSGINGVAGTILARIREMRFVQFVIGESAVPAGVEDLNLAGTLDAVGGGAIGRDVKGLVGILGPVKTVGTEDLVLGV